MKIFFCPENHRLKYIKDNFFKIFVTFIVITLFMAQGTAFFKRVGVQEVSVSPRIGAGSVTLTVTRGEHKGLRVLLNGEEAGVFLQNSITLSFDEDSVIEVVCTHDGIAAVEAAPGYGTTLVTEGGGKLCKKGLTYIGKAIISRE